MFKTKPEIGLEMTRSACEPSLPGALAIFDAGFGHDGKLRAGVTGTGEAYAAGIRPQTLAWKPCSPCSEVRKLQAAIRLT